MTIGNKPISSTDEPRIVKLDEVKLYNINLEADEIVILANPQLQYGLNLIH
jgi:hypothetical protein